MKKDINDIYYALAQDLQDCICCIADKSKRDRLLRYIEYLQEKDPNRETRKKLNPLCFASS